jgi:hypothetical protein
MCFDGFNSSLIGSMLHSFMIQYSPSYKTCGVIYMLVAYLIRRHLNSMQSDVIKFLVRKKMSIVDESICSQNIDCIQVLEYFGFGLFESLEVP